MSTLPRIEAVIFDCDGVLVDSEPVHDEATRAEMRERGIEVTDDFFAEAVGMRVIDQMGLLADRYGLDVDELYPAREQRFWRLVEDRFTAIPASADTVRRLHAAGLKIAVATSGTPQWIAYVVQRLGLQTEISAVVSAADVTEPKPHPQAYLSAAAALGVTPRRSGVVEDSQRGCRSAAAAGCLVVALDIEGADPQRFADAAQIVSSMPHAGDYLLRAATHGVDRWRRHRDADAPPRTTDPANHRI